MGAQSEGEAALVARQHRAVVADLEKSLVGDGQAEPPPLAGPMRECSTVGTDVPMLGFLFFGDGALDVLQPFGVALLHSLVGFPSLLAAFLVDVVRRVGLIPVSLPPGGDAFVHCVGEIPTAALG